MTLHLHPDDLGAVAVTVHLHGDSVAVHLHAAQPDTGGLLRDGADDLRRALAQQGLDLGALDVSVGDGDAGSPHPEPWEPVTAARPPRRAVAVRRSSEPIRLASPRSVAGLDLQL